jgi:zinc transport system ATP-binding protein
MDNQAVVEMKDVYFSYREFPVLKDVNIKIGKRDFLGIIGPNGGGKTTFLKLILGLLKPDKGTIRVFGKPPKEGRKHIGYMPQILNFDFDFPINVMEVVLMGRLGKRHLGRKFKKEDMQICSEALERVGMVDFKDRQIGDLSGGQRQRVFIARALATEPELLLLDEPASSTDQKWQHMLYELLQELSKNITIILVTHDVSVISTYIDKIACVSGKVRYHGSTKDGISKISEMYQCPVELIVHGISHTSIPHRLLEGAEDD